MINKKSRGLGRGLDVMIPQKVTVSAPEEPDNANAGDGVRAMVDINKVDRNKKQPRKKFDETALEELAESIKQYGVLQPILVQDRGKHYEIVAGERRWRAARLAGLKEVPVIIREFTEQEIAEISLIENLQREDLNAIEEAQAYKRLKEEFGLTDDQVADKVSKSRAAITNSMRLLKLDGRVQQMLIDEQISMGLARALLGVEDADQQYEMAQNAFDQRLSVREVEKQVKQLGAPQKKKREAEDLSQYQIHFDEYAEKLAQSLGVKVSVHLKEKNSGSLEIGFYNSDDFERLYEKLK
ncbi:MAG: ParB/RepB/Spo0J family partition protein [Lachnospiraceae bacterium]|nr:ParB/RepB/Spo0J family partition protein [Lachnospiraceae bacterium]